MSPSLAPRSLQARLLAAVLGLVTAVWLAMAVWTWFDVRHELGRAAGRPPGPGRRAAAGPAGPRAGRRPCRARRAQPAPLCAARGIPDVPRRPAAACVRPARRCSPWQHRCRASQTSAWTASPGAVFVSPPSAQGAQVYVAEQQASRGSILRAVLRSLVLPMGIRAAAAGAWPPGRQCATAWRRCAAWAGCWPRASRTRCSRCRCRMRPPRCSRCWTR